MPGHGRFAASAVEPQPLAGGPADAAPVQRLARRAFARGHEDMHPAERRGEGRARDELQPRSCGTIERKRARKGEGRRRGARRRRRRTSGAWRSEQERLREAFEREQVIQARAKAEERMRAEEEAFQAAAESAGSGSWWTCRSRETRRRRAATRRRKRRAFRRGFRITRTPARAGRGASAADARGRAS